jgi:undecaprenyl-diphosphatase
MDIIQSVILGLVQGFTEFIPVSSTGHLILIRSIMGLDLVGSLSFDAILQLATGLAVLIYFWNDIWNIIVNRNIKLIGLLIVGSIPAVILGILLQDYMDTVFRGTHVVAYALIAGAILFYFAEKKFKMETSEKSSTLNGVPNRSEEFSEVSIKRALGVGFFQCLALIPGMSRSGSTISGGLFLGLNREVAIRFSFLLSLPIIFGSGLKKVYDLSQINQGFTLIDLGGPLLTASFFAFLSGLLAIHFLLKFLKNHSLNYFGVYRIILAIVILIFL